MKSNLYKCSWVTAPTAKKKTNQTFNGVPEEGTIFGWVIHWDYHGQEVKDREEDDQLETLSSFKGADDQYELSVP